MLRHITAACALLVISNGIQADSAITSKEDFIAVSEKLVKENDIPGMAVAVVHPNGTIWAHGYGYADLAAKKPMTKNTVMAIASITKTVTGTAVMQLVEKGLIDLDKDVNTFLPFKVVNPKKPDAIITPRHMLTHTTGIVDSAAVYFSTDVYHSGGDNPLALGDFVKAYLTPGGKYYSEEDNFSDHAPGTYYEYSNIVYGLIGHMIEHVSGQAFNDYTRENILQPLGMNASGWKFHEIDAAATGKQYGRKDAETIIPYVGEPVGQWRAYAPYSIASYPDGGLRTSVSDLSHFLAAIMSGGIYKEHRILSEKTVTAMLTTQRFGNGKMPGLKEYEDQGLAFAYEPPAILGPDWIKLGHAGGDPGTMTGMYFDPKDKFGVIFFINGDTRAPEQIAAAQKIIKALFKHGQLLLKN